MAISSDVEIGVVTELRARGKDEDSQSPPSKLSQDEVVLARFGKRQQLRVSDFDSSLLRKRHAEAIEKRGFRSLSSVGLVCGVMLTWEVLAMSVFGNICETSLVSTNC